MPGSWLVPWHPEPGNRPVLLCVPPAGAGCGQFGSWQTAIGADVSVVGVQLPGRESRWTDPPAASVVEAVSCVTAELTALVAADQPIVVFGHSFGGLLGFDIARSLQRDHGRTPRGLVVAACRPPEHWVGAGRILADDDEELARLLDARGLEADDLDSDTRELMLHVLRQDALLSETYTGLDVDPVDFPLESWGGAEDRTVRPEQVEGWRGYAAGDFRARLFPGGHYFCLQNAGPAVDLLGPMARGAGAVTIHIGGTAR
jgi:surfactin synthase thioesterase subunit